jgi:hypothetical protein
MCLLSGCGCGSLSACLAGCLSECLSAQGDGSRRITPQCTGCNAFVYTSWCSTELVMRICHPCFACWTLSGLRCMYRNQSHWAGPRSLLAALSFTLHPLTSHAHSHFPHFPRTHPAHTHTPPQQRCTHVFQVISLYSSMVVKRGSTFSSACGRRSLAFLLAFALLFALILLCASRLAGKLQQRQRAWQLFSHATGCLAESSAVGALTESLGGSTAVPSLMALHGAHACRIGCLLHSYGSTEEHLAWDGASRLLSASQRRLRAEQGVRCRPATAERIALAHLSPQQRFWHLHYLSAYPLLSGSTFRALADFPLDHLCVGKVSEHFRFSPSTHERSPAALCVCCVFALAGCDG